MTIVLTYEGTQSQRPKAEAKLRRSLGGVTLTPKTSKSLECELEPEQVQQVVSEGVWRISEPVYAEICPPSANLLKLRQKLQAAK